MYCITSFSRKLYNNKYKFIVQASSKKLRMFYVVLKVQVLALVNKLWHFKKLLESKVRIKTVAVNFRYLRAWFLCLKIENECHARSIVSIICSFFLLVITVLKAVTQKE